MLIRHSTRAPLLAATGAIARAVFALRADPQAAWCTLRLATGSHGSHAGIQRALRGRRERSADGGAPGSRCRESLKLAAHPHQQAGYIRANLPSLQTTVRRLQDRGIYTPGSRSIATRIRCGTDVSTAERAVNQLPAAAAVGAFAATTGECSVGRCNCGRGTRQVMTATVDRDWCERYASGVSGSVMSGCAV